MKKLLYAFLTIILLLLPACNIPLASQPQDLKLPTLTDTSQEGELDPAFLNTAVAQTIVAELTNAAPGALPTATWTPIIPPTSMPSPTNTTIPSATATPIPCNQASFIADVTVPDGTAMLQGQAFTKTWRLGNVGTCTWTSGYQLVFHQGDAMGVPVGYAQALPDGSIPPGGTVDISVNLTAPSTNGTYKGLWRLREPGGQYFGIGPSGGNFYVMINVSSPVFAVTSVTFSVAGSCGDFHITANISTNGPGSVTYHWIRSDGATDMAVHPPLVYGSAGTESLLKDWYVSAAGAKWIDIYVDSPNHQQFGRANFSCP